MAELFTWHGGTGTIRVLGMEKNQRRKQPSLGLGISTIEGMIRQAMDIPLSDEEKKSYLKSLKTNDLKDKCKKRLKKV